MYGNFQELYIFALLADHSDLHTTGMWRSLVAYTHGVRVVAGSNPVIPTKKSSAGNC